MTAPYFPLTVDPRRQAAANLPGSDNPLVARPDQRPMGIGPRMANLTREDDRTWLDKLRSMVASQFMPGDMSTIGGMAKEMLNPVRAGAQTRDLVGQAAERFGRGQTGGAITAAALAAMNLPGIPKGGKIAEAAADVARPVERAVAQNAPIPQRWPFADQPFEPLMGAEGKPKTYYHGTRNAGFEQFETPSYFSSSPGESAMYSDPEWPIQMTWRGRRTSEGPDDLINLEEGITEIDANDWWEPNKWYELDGAAFRKIGTDRNGNAILEMSDRPYTLKYDHDKVKEIYEKAGGVVPITEPVGFKAVPLTEPNQPGTYKTFVSMRNPYRMHWEEGANLAGPGNMRGAVNRELIDRLKREGYDGVITESDWSMAENVIPFYPEQIQNAIGGKPFTEMMARDAGRQPITESAREAMQTIWHGTPHTWAPEPGYPLGRPRLDKMGTGEGAQAYGHGFYTAEARATGEQYRDALKTNSSDSRMVAPTGDYLDFPSWMASRIESEGPDALIDEWRKRIGEIKANPSRNQPWIDEGNIARLEDQIAKAERIRDAGGASVDRDLGRGKLYELEYPQSQIARMLDWDKPLSEQGDEVLQALGLNRSREALDAEFDALLSEAQAQGKNLSDEPFASRAKALEARLDRTIGTAGVPDVTGGEFYRSQDDMLFNDASGVRASDRGRSEWLQSQGIPGIKYLDAGSRGTGEGTRNFVIWDVDKLKVVRALAAAGMISQAALADIESQAKEQGIE